MRGAANILIQKFPVKTFLIIFTILLSGMSIAQVEDIAATHMQVTAVSPPANEISASVNSVLSATFDMALDVATLDSNSFIVYGEKGGHIRGVLAYNPTSRTVYFQPLVPFLPGDRITVILNNKIKSTEGYTLRYGFTWNFDIQVFQGIADFQLLTAKTNLALTAVATGDFDHDGQYDVVFAGQRGEQYYLQIMYYHNGVFEPGDVLEVPYPVRPIYVGDLNRDGYSDFVLIHRDMQNRFAVRYFSVCYLSPDGTLTLGQTFLVGKGDTEPRSAIINDLNSDGFLDIAIAKRVARSSTDNRTVLVYLNDGTGKFGQNGRETNWFWSDTNAESILSRDFNFDGYVDLAVTSQGSKAASLFLNPGNGWLFENTPDVILGVPEGFNYVDCEKGVTVDFNGDYQPDIIAADFGTDKIIYYQHAGLTDQTPKFRQPKTFTAQQTPYWMQYGDLDADGDFDVVTAGDNADFIALLQNDGAGDFSAKKNFGILRESSLFTTGDVNGDAALDLCFVSTDGTLTFLLNKTQGNVQPQAPVAEVPADGKYLNSLTVTLQWQVPDDQDGDDLHFRVTIMNLDGDSQGPLVYDSSVSPELFDPPPPLPSGIGTGSITVTLPKEGRYSWNVAAFDGQFVGPASETSLFYVDVTSPSNLVLELPDAIYDGHWFDPPAGTFISAELMYTEENPDSAILTTEGLGGPYVQTDIPAGVDQRVTFDVPADGANDGKYTIQGSITDRAGNKSSVPSWIGIDRQPPSGTTAHTLGDTSSSVMISVSWSGATDGAGSGLAGVYSVQVREDDGPWTLWLERTTSTDTFYTGTHLKRYEFEAAAYDNIGHFEGFANIAEATVFVDTTVDDVTPPGKPRNLTANGANPSPWQTGNEFTITWDVPPDESGISQSFWKLGSPPMANDDYHGSNGPEGPLEITVEEDGRFPLYVWLADSKGNVDYQNYALVLLRRDATPPVLEQMIVENPEPVFVDDEPTYWFNSSQTKQFDCRMVYTETYTDRVDLDTKELAGLLTATNVPDGQSVSTTFTINAADATDGIYSLTGTVTDSAGSSDVGTVKVGFDGTPPSGCVAQAADTSFTLNFIVSWTTGSDSGGSGLAGKYDVYVRKDGQSWVSWLIDATTQESTFTGEQGSVYEFEAITKDNVGNAEVLLGQAEATVLVDTLASDRTPPPAPLKLSANGSSPSPWNNEPTFEITWELPEDESGISKAFYKLGEPPGANNDYLAAVPPAEPLQVKVEAKGITPLFLWLADGRGNVDYRNYAQVNLRYDPDTPVINSFTLTDPNYGEEWYNPVLSEQAHGTLVYSEPRADSLIVVSEQLNYRYVDKNPLSGENMPVPFTIDIASAGDGQYDVIAAVVDSAGNTQTSSLVIKLDRTPPHGTQAVSPDTSSELSFFVSWSGASDSNGVGLSGKYDVRYRVEDGQWQNWLSEFEGTAAEFTNGKQGLRFYFEAAAWDRLKNREAFLGVAETSTLVDTTADDVLPPPPPLNLTADGSSPSPWKTTPSFTLKWQVPEDPSGVIKSYYKVGEAPKSNADTTGRAGANGPIVVKATLEGGQYVYVWLQDSRGNVSYQNAARVLLRYDNTPPVINETAYKNPGYAPNWFNPTKQDTAILSINYHERFASSLRLKSEGLALNTVIKEPGSGLDITRDVRINIHGKPNGRHLIHIALADSAGNETTFVDTLNLDGKPPTGTIASSPDTSAHSRFTVSWIGGTDGDGVGVSDTFDVRVNQDGGGWKMWLQKYGGTSAEFKAAHGHTYAFEAAAYDRLGNREAFTGVAETKTLVDTTILDFEAPAAPEGLLASGANPSPWQAEPEFRIVWETPPDPSGIIKSYYKLGGPPQAPDDTTGTAAAVPPIVVTATEEDGQMLYLWLEDGQHNVDFRNYASVLLRWDATLPQIDSLVLTEAMYAGHWFNPVIIGGTTLKVYYQEAHPQNVKLDTDSLLLSPAQTVPMDSAGMAAFQLVFPDSANKIFTLRATVLDSAGQSTTDSTFLALDSTPPSGTVANSPDTTGPGEFMVMWGNADDGDGSGVSGIYDVRVRIDDGDWQPWMTRFEGTEAPYEGEASHFYAFEAAAYDNVRNRESFTGTPETITYVQANFSDVTAPESPQNLTADGSNPSPWSNEPEFELNWDNPADPSGIARCLYKIGARPEFESDTTGSASGTPPIRITAEMEGENYLYLWLQDGRGNADHTTADSVLLRYDATPPRIDSLVITNAQFMGRWLNPDSASQAIVRVYFEEQFPDSARLFTGALQGELAGTNIEGDEIKFVEFQLPLADVADGCYRIKGVVADSAGNAAEDTLQLCIDSTPPVNAIAVSPEVSLSNEFTVSWAGENQGSDGDGSGLSGEYDIRIRIDQGQWFFWLQREKRLSAAYVGVHGHTYSFEIAAWDNVGNREPFLGQAETSTLIDTAFVDETAPEAPSHVLASGGNPSPWQNTPQFEVTWEDPVDPSGIGHVYYKLGEAPQYDADTTGVASADKPLIVTATQEYGQMLHIWLDDGKGNVDYRNHASVLLRYDATPPVIDSTKALDPLYADNWFNQKKTGRIYFRTYFDEFYPAEIKVFNPNLSETVLSGDSLANKQDSVQVGLKVAEALDGQYWIYVAMKDSAGNESQQDSLLIHLDSTPPTIHYNSAGLVIDEGQPFTITTVVTDENRVESVRLQYWKGGSRFRISDDMTRLNDSTFTAEIPAKYVTSRGVGYAIWASDGLSLIRKPPMTESSTTGYFARVKVVGEAQQGLQRPQPLVHGVEANAYRMISFPLEIEDATPASVLEDNLGPYDTNRWRFFYWNTLENKFLEYPNTGGLAPGRAFWLITSIKDVILDTGPGMSVDASGAFIIPLRKGWNDIGNPFNFEIEWRDIFIASAADTQKVMGPYTYRKKWLLPFEVTTMQPWEGYSFYTESDDISLAIPPLEARKNLSKKSLPLPFQKAQWLFSIAARIDSATDTGNYFGCIENATESWDYGYDFVEPPPVGQFISLYFPHVDEELDAWQFTTDFYPPASGNIWNFEVTSNIKNKEAALVFHRLKPVSNDFDLTLVDADANLSVDLLKDSTYSFWFSDTSTVRHFRIYAGNTQFMENHEQDIPILPDEFMLVQNFPNPFNSSTVISYRLDEDTEVQVSIYNLLAQRIKLLYEGFQQKGFYQYRWDARDENGNEIGTGIYLIRLETPKYKATRKMVYMR